MARGSRGKDHAAAKELARARELLRASGLRATAARIAVLRVLGEATRPLSHADVCERLARESFDRATIYRNLVDLAEHGLVKRTDVGDHVWRFELRDEAHDEADAAHPHFVCSDCGKLECLPEAAIALHAVRGTPRALRDRDVEIQVRGRCDSCS